MCSKAFSPIVFSVIFRASNYQLVDKRMKAEMFFKLSNLNSNLALTLGYLNPALNNSADSTMIAKSPEKTRREHPLFPRLLANNGARENALGTTWG